MKSKLFVAAFAAFLLASAPDAFTQVSNDYRSAISGNWNSTNTWERFNGTAWVPATNTPTSASLAITIQSGHVVTVTAAVTVDQVTVNAGGEVAVNSGIIWTINDGTAATDLAVNGALTIAGTVAGTGGPIIAINGLVNNSGTMSTATVNFNTNSIYRHIGNGGTIPTANWNSGSTCEILGITTTVPTGLAQDFHHFIWNCTNQAASIDLGRNLTTVNGDLTIQTTGSGTLTGNTNSVTGNYALVVGGSFTMQSGSFLFSSAGTGSRTLTVSGNMNLQGGTFNFCSGGTGTATINLAGSFNQTGGTFQQTSATDVAFNFTGANRTFSQSSGTLLTTNMNFNVNNGASLTLNSSLTVSALQTFTVLSGGTLNCETSVLSGGGTFTLNAGGWLGIGDANGITTAGNATGNIQTTTRTYSATGNYIYRNGGSQSFGNGLTGASNLILTNGTSVTLGSALAVSGVLTIASGSSLDASSQTLTLSGGGSPLVINGTLTTSTSTVQYTGAGPVNVVGGISYYNLTVNNSGETYILAGDITVGHVLTVQAGTLNASNRTVTLPDSGTPLVMTGSILPGSSTFLFSSPTGATIGAGTFFNLTLAAGTTFTLSGLPSVSGTLNLNGSMLATGSNQITVLNTSNSSITGSSSTSYVNGTLQKAFAVGSQTFTFPIGDSTTYAPINVAGMNVTTAGNLRARTVAGNHPQFATDGLDANNNINRYWTLTNYAGAIVVSTNTVTFNYPASDVDSGANAAAFLVRRWNGGWNAAAVSGTPTTTATTARLGAAAFGDFDIGNQETTASSVIFTQQPVTATAGQTMAQIKVQARDSGNLGVPNASVSLTLNSGTLNGTTTQIADATGVATFSDLSINQSGAGKILTATADGHSTNSTSFTVNSAAGTHLTFSTEPANATAGATMSSVVVQIKDQFENNVSSNAIPITVTVSGGFMNGTRTNNTASTGAATFNTLNITLAGTNKIMTASGLGNGAGWTSATSDPFNINSGTFSKLQLLVPGETAVPGSTTGKSGTPSAQAVGAPLEITVNSVDANWNPIGTNDTIRITSNDTNNTILPPNTALTNGLATLGVTFMAARTNATLTASNVTHSAIGGNTSPLIVVNKGSQTITFDPIGDKIYGVPPFGVHATASSGLTVSFSIVSGPATISGTNVTITAAGTVVVRAAQAGNTNWNAAPTVDQSFEVTKVSQSITFNPLSDKLYGAAPFSLTATASSGLPVSFAVNSGPASISGSTLTITGAGLVVVDALQPGDSTYEAATVVQQSFTINPATLTVTADNKSKIYGAALPTLTAHITGFVYGETFGTGGISGMADLSTAAVANSPVAGNPYTIVAAIGTLSAANYTFSFVSGVLTANPATLTGHVTADGKSYDGTTAATIASRTLDGIVGSDDVNLVGGTAQFIDQHVGTGKTVNATGLTLAGVDVGNYTLASAAAATTANITAAAITVTAASDSKVYDGTTASSATPTITLGSLAAGDTSNFSQSFDDKNVGSSKTLMPAGSINDGNGGSNYVVTFANDTSGVITARDLTVTATGVSRGYDATTVASVTLSDDRIGGDSLNTGYATAEFVDKNVGTGKTVNVSGISVTGLDSGNYTFNSTATASADISSAELTVSGITASNKPYDGNMAATLNLNSAALVGVFGGDVVTLNTNSAVGAFADASVANGKTVIVSGLSLEGDDAGNYSLTQPTATANITRAVLTVTAVDTARAYGDTNPVFTATYTGFLGSDDVQVLTGAPELSSSAETNSPVADSPFAIVIAGGTLSSTNYDFAFVNGLLTVTQAVLTVTADDQTKFYNEPVPPLTSSYSGFVNGEDASVLSGEPERSTTATAASGVAGGPYVIAVTNGTLTASNYSFAFVSGQLTVTPIEVVPSITADNKMYDGTMAAAIASRSLDGVIGADDVSLSGGTALFADKHAGPGKTVVAFDLTLSGVDAANYFLDPDIAVTSADITARPLTVSASAVDKVYDGTADAGVALSDDRLSGDNLTVNYTAASFADKHVGTDKLVSVIGISLSDADAGDYTCNTTAGTTASITIRAVTVTATADSKAYDGTTASSVAPTFSSGSLAVGDISTLSQVFDSKDVGTGKTLTPGGSINDGNGGNNYTVSFVTASNGVIVGATLTPSITANSKIYDATTDATILSRTLGGVIGSEDVSLTGGTATFSDKHVGSGKTVTALGLSLSGVDAANYSLSSTTAATTADITARALTVTATGIDKVYDGTTAAAVTLADNRIFGDDLATSHIAASFADKHIGTNKLVSVTGISLAGPDAGDYAFNTNAATTASITLRAITVTATAHSKAYDGTAASSAIPAVSSGSIASGDTATLSQVFDNKNVGTDKTLTPSGSINDGNSGNNYSVSFVNDTNGVIAAASVTPTITADSKVYDGTIAATITSRNIGGVIGSEDVSLTGGTATFADKEVGTGKTVTAVGLSLSGVDAANYSLSSTSAATTADITKASIVVTAENKSKAYGTSNPTLTVVYSGFISGDDEGVLAGTPAINTSATDFSSVGNYAVEVALGSLSADNYSFSFVDGTLTITKAMLTVTADDATRAYGASNPVFTANYTGFLGSDDMQVLAGVPELTSSADTNSPVGDSPYSIAISNGTLSATNYTFAFVNGSLTITQAVLTVTADDQTKVYGAPVPPLTASYSGFVNGEDATVLSGEPDRSTTATAASSVVVGPYVIAVTNGTLTASNYSFAFIDGQLAVTVATLTPSITADSKIYDATINATILSRTLGGVIGSDDVSLSGGTATFADKHVGPGKTVTASGLSLSGVDAANYSLSSTSAATTADITARALTVTATGIDKVYDGTADANVTLADDRILGDDLATSHTAASFANKHVGTGKPVSVTGISVSGGDAGDYTFNTSAGTTANITARAITVTATADSKTYDGTAASSATPAVLLGSIASGDSATLSQVFDNKNVGTGKTLTPSGSITDGNSGNNYSVSLVNNTNGVITTVALTPSITADSKVYDGTIAATIASRNIGGVIGSEDVSLTGGTATFADKEVGTGKTVTAVGLSLSGVDAANYSLSSTSAATTADITKASIVVTAENKSKAYGASNPTLTVVYSGFISGDDEGVLTGTPAINTSATDFSPVGNYAVEVALGSLSADNYSFSFVDGTLTITKAMLTVTADDATRAYGASNPVFTANYTGFLGSDDMQVLAGVPELTSSADTNSPVSDSPYSIVISNGTLSATNYNFAFVNGSLTITQAVLTVTADDQTKVYGAPVPLLTVNYSGFVNGEDASVLSGEPERSTTATAASSVVGGPYVIAVTNGTLTASNYSFAFVDGQLAVTVATLTPNITANSKVYDATTNATILSRTLGGVIGSDDVSLSGGTATFADKHVGLGKTVTASGLSLSGVDAANYSLSSTTATTTADITKASLIVTAENKGKTRGLANPLLTATYTGFVIGEGTNVLTSLPALSTTADATSPAGIYAIDAAGAAAADYDISYVSGALTVTAEPALGNATVSGNQIGFNVPTIAGQQYQVEFKAILTDPWTPLGEPIMGTGEPIAILNEISGPQGFFRLKITMP